MVTVHPKAFSICSVIAGILILIFPPLLNYVVAFYLIIIGILGMIALS